jgi:hypothetical protein
MIKLILIPSYFIILILISIFHTNQYQHTPPLNNNELLHQQNLLDLWRSIVQVIKVANAAGSAENVVERKSQEWMEFVGRVPMYPQNMFQGRGIVIPAGKNI